MQQNIQYCIARDGVRLAFSIVGRGPKLVRTPHWFAHLEYDLDSPVMRHTILGLAHNHTVLRYDPRGIGMSQRDVADISFERWVQDFETVMDAAQFDRFILLGLSQGCAQAISFAARHPERVSHLILYGGFARGLLNRENPEKQKQTVELARGLVRQGWGSDEESHRQFFTSQFIPDGTPELHHSLNEIQRRAATPEMAERYLVAIANINVTDLLPQVKVPTLVLHPTGDLRVPITLGQEMAAAIPGAKFVPLETRNHLITGQEPAHRTMLDAIADFLGEKHIHGHLPGTTGLAERIDSTIGNVERNWFIKIIIIFAALTGCVLFFIEIWHLVHGGQ